MHPIEARRKSLILRSQRLAGVSFLGCLASVLALENPMFAWFMLGMGLVCVVMVALSTYLFFRAFMGVRVANDVPRAVALAEWKRSYPRGIVWR